MRELTVSETGVIIIDNAEILAHMGVNAGDTIRFSLLSNQAIRLSPVERSVANEKKKQLADLIGLWAGKTDKAATLEEIQETIAKGWAGQLSQEDNHDNR